MKETKAFYKTSEFWLMVLGQIVLTLQTSGAIDIVSHKYTWLSPILQTIIASAYILSRGQAKSGIPIGVDDQPLPEPDYPEKVTPGTNLNT
jgi:hypothetical protein